MASLTVVSKRTKKVFVISVAVIVASIILKIIVSIIGFADYVINISAPVVANNAFGPMPQIQVNALPYNSNNQTQYVLNTPNGGFPQEPQVADVYKYTGNTGLTVLSLDDATKKAAYFGFTSIYNQLSNTIYDWPQSSKDFVYNVSTSQFRIANKNPYGQIQSDTNPSGNLPLTEAGATQAAVSIVKGLGVGNDYDLSNPTLILLKYNSNSDVTVQNDASDINAITVEFFRSYKFLNINSFKSLSSSKLTLLADNPLSGNISVTVDSDSATATAGILNFNYSYWPLDATQYGVYNIKTSQQAWQDVQNGSAYLVSLVKQGSYPFNAYQTLSVNQFQAESISLAYFDGIKQQSYLQPIYVIKGTAILQDGSSATFYFYDSAVI